MSNGVKRYFVEGPDWELCEDDAGELVEFEAYNALLVEFERFVEVASGCDSWESFPSNELVRAYKVIENAKGEYNEQ